MQSIKPELQPLSQYPFTAAALSHDGETVSTIDNKGTISLWNTRSGKLQRAFTLPKSAQNFSDKVAPDLRARLGKSFNQKPYLVALSPDQKLIVCAWYERIGVWDVHNGQFQSYLVGKTQNIRQLAFSANSQNLIVGGNGDEGYKPFLEIWNMKTKKVIQTQGASANTPDYFPTTCVFSPDGRFYARNSNYGALTVWDAKTGDGMWQTREKNSEQRALVFSPDSRWLLSSGGETATLWDAKSGAKQKVLLEGEYQITQAAYSPDGDWVALLQGQRHLTLCHLSSNRLVVLVWPAQSKSYSGRNSSVRDLAFSSDGTRLQCVLPNGQLAIWRFKKPLLPLTVAKSKVIVKE